MSPFAPRRLAFLSGLLVSAALPVSASAAANGGELCAIAAADPAAFVAHPDFAQRLLQMEGSCDSMIFALTNVTSAIPVLPRAGDGSDAAPVDYSDLVDRLEKATADLDDATKTVARKQAALDRSLRRARDLGIGDDDIRLITVMDNMLDDYPRPADFKKRAERVLPDFTAAKRRALENVLEAQEALDRAKADLDEATRAAEPLVEKALELSGLADAAQGDLDAVLGGLTADERRAEIEKAIAAAKEEAANLAAKAETVEEKLSAVEKALKEATSSRKYRRAVEEVTEEEEDYARAKHILGKAEAALTEAEARFRSELRNNRCNSHSCAAAFVAYKVAGEIVAKAKANVVDQADDLEDAKKKLAKLEEAFKIPELSAAVVTLTSDLSAVEAAGELAEEQAKAAAARAEELCDLLGDAAEALAKAKEASAEAQAATAEEEADVLAAEAALKQAMAEAEEVLAGSAAEAAALQAVLDAQAELTEALAALGLAQDGAEALAQEIAQIDAPPAAVTEAAAEMADGSEAAEMATEAAEESLAEAEAALADHQDATDDLAAALGGSDAARTDDTVVQAEGAEGDDGTS